MVNLESISWQEQPDFISSFWTMLQECEAHADHNTDPVLKIWVEQWYVQWNRVTNDNLRPIWQTRAQQVIQATLDANRSAGH